MDMHRLWEGLHEAVRTPPQGIFFLLHTQICLASIRRPHVPHSDATQRDRDGATSRTNAHTNKPQGGPRSRTPMCGGAYLGLGCIWSCNMATDSRSPGVRHNVVSTIPDTWRAPIRERDVMEEHTHVGNRLQR
jgi:hypothetical protein